MGHGWEGVVLKAFRGKDFRLTVVDAHDVAPRLRSVAVEDGGLLAACGVHPTMWIRMWFERDGRPHQRGFTLVDPDPAAGRFRLEFALHDGPASDWARAAAPGQQIDVTVQGSRFAGPDGGTAGRVDDGRAYLVGDLASVPAVNSLLDHLGDRPATIWLEYAHDDERLAPLRTGPQHEVTWVPRRDGGGHLVTTVTEGVADASGRDWFWIACEATSTRALTRHLRKDRGFGKDRVDALAYWREVDAS